MTSQAECRSHAALCKQLARQDPTNEFVWRAEAEYWSRLSSDRLRSEPQTKNTFGSLAGRAVKFGGVSVAQPQMDEGVTGATNAGADAAFRAATEFVHAPSFAMSARSLIANWVRRIELFHASIDRRRRSPKSLSSA